MTLGEFIEEYKCIDMQCDKDDCGKCRQLISEDIGSFMDMVGSNDEVFEWLRDQKEKSGLSVTQIAIKTGLNSTTLDSYFWKGHIGSISIVKVIALANAFGYSLAMVKR